MGIIETIVGEQIYLDANIFIYAVEGLAPWDKIVKKIFTSIDKNECSAVTSVLTYAECLVQPLRLGRNDITQIYTELLENNDLLTVSSIDKQVIIQAAHIRSNNRSLKLPDALHLATAQLCNCTYFITNDQNFSSLPNLNILLLSKFAK